MSQQVKVSIIGGGCAAMATAFELTRPEHRGKYAVTIHQQGWRLGGKGASGRKAPSDRIEEHGLHLWMGFYENAFRMMRECYAEAGRDPATCPLATWEDAFKPDNYVGVTERTSAGWANWSAMFPPAAGLPGDPLTGATPFSIPAYLTRCVLLLKTLVTSVQDRAPVAEVKGSTNLAKAVADLVGATISGVRADPAASAARARAYASLTVSAVISEALDILSHVLSGGAETWRDPPTGQMSAVIASLSAVFRAQIHSLAAADPEVRRVWEIVDVVLAIVRGILRDGLIFNPAGFDAIDHMDWRDWLRKHGASKSSLDAAFIRGSYDLLFAYENGDTKKPRMAAGQALRGAMRMFFTYRGALFWKMQAGMGDVVFAPFYEVLKARGVTFRFFRRLENIGLSDDKGHIRALTFSRQAETPNGYNPLKTVNGVPSWPAAPDLQQLGAVATSPPGWDPESRWETRNVVGAPAESETWEVSKDFDFAVLAVGLGEVPISASELVAASADWRRMTETVGAVATQAFQVWLKEPVETLGWSEPPINISGYVEPFDTWADMRQLIERENVSPAPGAVAYFCSVLPDAHYPSAVDLAKSPHPEAHARVRSGVVNFLNRHVGHFWPGAVTEAGFRWDLLATESPEEDAIEGEARIDSQFWTANVNPTDRYVLSLPGTQSARISPLDSKFDNLTVAGDWTACGHMAGCVEAAVMSGRLAAHAICQAPRLEEIIGYDHP